MTSLLSRRQLPGLSQATRVLATWDRLGRLGRAVTSDLDLARSIGPRAMFDRHEDAQATALLLHQRRESVYREIWVNAAICVGAQLTPMGGGLSAISRDGRTTFVRQRHVMLDSRLAVSLADDKVRTQELLAAAGLPVPRRVVSRFPDLAAADELRMGAAGPVVVKPAFGTSGGFGVTCGISTPDDLVRACLHATRWDPHVMVEEQGSGIEYRALVLDGEVIDVIRREPPSVLGDGMSSVGELVAAENERRRTSNGRLGYSHVAVDLDCVLALRRQGLRLRSVPARGARIALKSSANDGGPEETETVRAAPAELVRAAVAASRAVRLRLAAVELITPDPTVPLASAGGVVIEVNGEPGLHYHYQVQEAARATPVASRILERLLAAPSVQ